MQIEMPFVHLLVFKITEGLQRIEIGSCFLILYRVHILRYGCSLVVGYECNTQFVVMTGRKYVDWLWLIPRQRPSALIAY